MTPTEPSVPLQEESCAQVRIVNDLSEIARVTELVESFGARHAFSLDEILNNIISYGYDDGGRHDIDVRLGLGSGGIEVIVEDDGKPFDPLAVQTPRPRSETEVGGVGLHFVRSLMDQLDYSRHDGINRLRLVKKLEQ
jgi:anti-sigma regulatory factor (Ser/Thr protein kinase)